MEKSDLLLKINSLIDRQNRIYVLRGFNNLVNKDDISTEALLANEFQEWIEDKPTLNIARKVISKLNGQSYVCYFEELYMFMSIIDSIIQDFSYSISIIDFNLYDTFYPSLDNISKKAYSKLDSFVDENTNVQKVFSAYHLGAISTMVMYNDLENSRDFELIPIFSDSIIKFECLNEECGNFDLSSEESKEEFSENLFKILMSDKFEINILSSTSKQLDFSQKRSISILHRLGLKVNCYLPRIIKVIEDETKYLEILHRRDLNYSFKELKVYRNPGISNELEEVSQVVIIDDIIENAKKAMRGESFNDIFVTAPTGSGKSIMFQIPAIYLAESEIKCVTIIVSPLISLMNDQVRNIQDLTDFACAINSDYTPKEKDTVRSDIHNGKKSILY